MSGITHDYTRPDDNKIKGTHEFYEKLMNRFSYIFPIGSISCFFYKTKIASLKSHETNQEKWKEQKIVEMSLLITAVLYGILLLLNDLMKGGVVLKFYGEELRVLNSVPEMFFPIFVMWMFWKLDKKTMITTVAPK
ncbi:unnamed protein product [Caenorhabditis brenneri]